MNLDNEKSSKGKFFGYLICTDCDGTLTYDIGKVSEKNVRAIKYFQSEGGLFTLATGRFPNHLEMFKGQFEINAPMASFNGTLLYDTKNNKPLKTWTVSSKKCLNMIKYILEKYDIWELWINGVTSEGEFTGVGYKPSEHKKGDGSIDETFNEMPFEIFKIVVMQPENLTYIIQKNLKEKFGQEFRFDTSWANGLEIQSIDSGKGVAVKYMKENVCKNVHTTIGIGDYENDLSLLESSDIGYAVDNAIDSVKEAADRITVANTNDAIAAIIEELENNIDAKQ